MTTFTIVNLIGWTTLLISYVVKWYLTKKEDKAQLELNERIAKMNELSLEGRVQLTFDIEDHKIKRFGAFGSYGIFSQLLTFGIGLFTANLIFYFFN